MILKSLDLSGGFSVFKNEIMQKIRIGNGRHYESIYKLIGLYGITSEFKDDIISIVHDKNTDCFIRKIALKSLVLSNNPPEFKDYIMQIFGGDRVMERDDSWARGDMALEAIRSIQSDTTLIHELMQICPDSKCYGEFCDEIDRTLIILNNAPATSSGEASSSRTRSPERRQGDRSGEGSSAQGGQLIDQMKRILEEHSQMKERENKLKQEAEQRLQRELARVRREEQQKLQQERDRFQRQLGDAEQERDQARGERDRFQRQLGDAREERDQAQR